MSQYEINQLENRRESQESYSSGTESMDSEDDEQENVLEILESRFLWQNKVSLEFGQLFCKD